MNLADVNTPAKFTEESPNYSGDKSVSVRDVTKQTKLRQRAERTILKMASDNKVPVETVVQRILLQSLPELRRYVQAKGEAPNSSPLLLAAQATLLRADEVGTIAKALDTNDMDALLQIESAENDAIDNNNADADAFLSPDVAAAVKLTLDHIKNVDVKTKGSGNLKDFISRAKQKTKGNGFDLNTAHLLGVPDHEAIGSKSLGGSDSPNGFDLGYVDPNAGLNYLTSNEKTSGGFFSIFDKIVNGINSVSQSVSGAASSVQDAIGSTKNSISNLLNQTSNTASNIGADSITKAMQQYVPYIIAGVIAITLIIVIAIYASKRK